VASVQCLGTTSRSPRCFASELGGHVTPGGLLQGYRAVTVRERLRNQRHTARNRENTGVYVFTRVNASGMSEFGAKRRVRGSCGSNQGCCGVNVMKIEDRGWNRPPGHRQRGEVRQ
jgi:hypothetical protein